MFKWPALAAVKSMADAFLQEATQAPHPMQAAASMALSGEYDAIFMDVHMPVIDGLEATRRIRRQEDATRHSNIIIGLSADAMLMEQQDGISAGMDDYLTKPIDKNVIHDVLVNISRVRRHELPQDIPSLTAV